MVTLVRPRSISFKCRSVIAIPAAIAGKYNRSDQVSFGRGTVIAISTPAPARNHNHARSVSITTSKSFIVMMAYAGKLRIRIGIRLGLEESLSVEKGDDGGGQKNVHERDLEEENPAQPHQLIVAETRQSEADPDKNKKKRRNFGEENEDVNETKNPSVGTVRDTRKMPATQKKGNDNGGAGNHGSVFAEEKEGELHRAVFGVIAADQFRFRFRQIEGPPLCFREYGDGKDRERYPHRNSQQPTDRIFPVPGKWEYHPAMIDLILHNFR